MQDGTDTVDRPATYFRQSSQGSGGYGKCGGCAGIEAGPGVVRMSFVWLMQRRWQGALRESQQPAQAEHQRQIEADGRTQRTVERYLRMGLGVLFAVDFKHDRASATVRANQWFAQCKIETNAVGMSQGAGKRAEYNASDQQCRNQ
jgi:hypothetical protein